MLEQVRCRKILSLLMVRLFLEAPRALFYASENVKLPFNLTGPIKTFICIKPFGCRHGTSASIFLSHVFTYKIPCVTQTLNLKVPYSFTEKILEYYMYW